MRYRPMLLCGVFSVLLFAGACVSVRYGDCVADFRFKARIVDSDTGQDVTGAKMGMSTNLPNAPFKEVQDFAWDADTRRYTGGVKLWFGLKMSRHTPSASIPEDAYSPSEYYWRISAPEYVSKTLPVKTCDIHHAMDVEHDFGTILLEREVDHEAH